MILMFHDITNYNILFLIRMFSVGQMLENDPIPLIYKPKQRIMDNDYYDLV